MHRDLFHLGNVTIYTYGLCAALAFLVSTALAIFSARRYGLSRETVAVFIVAIVVGGLVGGRVLFAILHSANYSSHLLQALVATRGGLAIQGAVAGAVVAGLVASHLEKVSFLRMCDLVTPYAALGEAIGRIGCFMHGCCYGKVITEGLGITYPGEAVMRIPAQLYSSASLVLLFLILRILQDRRTMVGSVFAWYLILYSICRFLTGILRDDTAAIFLGLTPVQVVSAAMLASGILLLAVLRRRSKNCAPHFES